jgi:hypothetical protein
MEAGGGNGRYVSAEASKNLLFWLVHNPILVPEGTTNRWLFAYHCVVFAPPEASVAGKQVLQGVESLPSITSGSKALNATKISKQITTLNLCSWESSANNYAYPVLS